MSTTPNEAVAPTDQQNKMLFWACFAALIATSFGFIIRALLIDTWGAQFNLTEVQKGEIFGAGLWPFAISIILFSLIIDRIGYGTAMAFAFICHIASVVLTVTATGYTQLYWAMFICALANGTVEAVSNPVVATLFPTAKVRWLGSACLTSPISWRARRPRWRWRSWARKSSKWNVRRASPDHRRSTV